VKFLLDNWMLIAVALMSAGMLAWPVITGGGGPGTVTAAGAVQLINREKAVVVDVCEAGEYASGHVAGARHAPLGELEQKLPGLVKNKSVPIILVCHAGDPCLRLRRPLGTSRVDCPQAGL
jgi:hypothetical protein